MVQLGQSRLVAVNTKYSVKYEAKWIQVFLIKGTEKILYYRYGRRPVDSLVYAIKQKKKFFAPGTGCAVGSYKVDGLGSTPRRSTYYDKTLPIRSGG